MSDYRLLAIDMDGTLLTSDKRISPRTVDALRKAADAGVTVALSTGRTTAELYDYRAELDGVISYAGLVSGGVVRNMTTGETLHAQSLDIDVARAVVAQGLAEHAMVQILTPEYSVMTHADVDRMPELGQGIYQRLALQWGHLVDDIAAFLEGHPSDACKINLHHVDRASCERTHKVLEGLPVQVAAGESASIEVTPLGVTKAHGLELLSEHLGLSLAQTIVVGDGDNDLDAFSVAGLAVAMGNAVPEVMARAHAVVADNDHDGIAEAVERWIL
jgi:Cof subfamily protein (haloacid dehalogenase superfamily)